MRQYAGFSTARESNARYRYLLAQGQTGLSVAFDLPTQIGFDSDHALARGEVGRVGVAIDSIEDMETLLDGIPLDEVSISMTINATASILLGFLLAVARRRGHGVEGAVGDDPERHPEGVRGARDLRLPSEAVDAPHHRHLRLLRRERPALEHHLHLGLPHPRGGLDGGPGGRLHARGRRRVPLGRGEGGPRREVDRAAPDLLLQRPQRLPRGDRQVPRGAHSLGAPR